MVESGKLRVGFQAQSPWRGEDILLASLSPALRQEMEKKGAPSRQRRRRP